MTMIKFIFDELECCISSRMYSNYGTTTKCKKEGWMDGWMDGLIDEWIIIQYVIFYISSEFSY